MNFKSIAPANKDRPLARRDWNPFESLQREVDRLFHDFTRAGPLTGPIALTPSIDVSETDREIEIAVELPGLEERDVHVDLIDGILTIRGEKKIEKEEKDKTYRIVERSYGSFERSLELPAGVDPAAIRASMTRGVLKVNIPKPAPAQSKKIEVKSAA